MYLFDNDFGEKVPKFLSEYQVPLYFKEDFFGLLDSKTRPSFRWILIGPPRSGILRYFM
jgi:histone arginine demethylase JMJD6